MEHAAVNSQFYTAQSFFDALVSYAAAYAAATTTTTMAGSSTYEPSRAKKRKLDCTSTSSSDTSGLLYDRRGHVTFRPYSDSLDSPHQTFYSLLETQLPLHKNRSGLTGSIQPSKCHKGVSLHDNIDNKDSGCSIANIFPEVLTTIFKYLDVQSKGRAAQACQKWRDVAYYKCVWKNTEARLHLHRHNPNLFPSLVKRGIKRVQVLSLKKSLKDLVNGMPNLESLNLSGCYNLNDSSLEGVFVRDLSSLKELNLSLCKDVSDNSMQRISSSCKNLEVLDLAGCSKITNASLLSISHLKNLKRLNLRSCRLISDRGIEHLCCLYCQQRDVAIEELCLQDCQKLTDESLKHISVGLANLQRINLSFCISVTDTGMKSLARLPALNYINIRSCDNVSDIGIGYLSESFHKLKELDISFCTNITDASLKHIATGIQTLKSLALTTCTITDDGLHRISKTLNDLENLNISQCIAVTDDGILSLVENLKNLAFLDIYGCPKLTLCAIESVRKSPNLKQLNLEL